MRPVRVVSAMCSRRFWASRRDAALYTESLARACVTVKEIVIRMTRMDADER